MKQVLQDKIIQQVVIMAVVIVSIPVRAREWSVPVAGNAFQSAPNPGNLGMRRSGTLSWSDPKAIFSIYFHVDRPAVLDLAIRARVPKGRTKLVIRVGERTIATELQGDEESVHKVGRIEATQAGYVRVDLQGVERDADVYAEVSELVLTSNTDGLAISYVKTNEGNMFYWGRRGPSVHLRYEVPRDRDLQYAYSEITVPQGKDPIGSFYMANGFAEGYFGMQVNGANERRILFSVWSPFQTDNPQDVPEAERVALLGKGADVNVGEFGNEGSGGQSFLVYRWKTDTTYRFLTEVYPEGDGSTVYTSWFGDKAAEEWRLLSRFRRPKTMTHLRGFHSFLESFNPDYGHLERLAHYGNTWVRDTDGQWHECTTARFSVDATGGGGHRLDFAGGVKQPYFYLRNCGFFAETSTPGAMFERYSTVRQRPDIDFDTLPRD